MTKSVKFAGENSVFAQRLKAIMKEKGVTQQQLAEQLHMTRQAVSLYLTGQALPAIDKLLTITDYFDVSADYLIGKTDVRTQDTDVKMICDYTGLSEEAVANLHNLYHELREEYSLIPYHSETMEVINFMLENRMFFKAANEMKRAYNLLQGAYEITSEIKALFEETPGLAEAIADHMKDFNQYKESTERTIGKEKCSSFMKTVEEIVDESLYIKYDLGSFGEYGTVLDAALMRIDELMEKQKFERYEAVQKIEYLFDLYIEELRECINDRRKDIDMYFMGLVTD